MSLRSFSSCSSPSPTNSCSDKLSDDVFRETFEGTTSRPCPVERSWGCSVATGQGSPAVGLRTGVEINPGNTFIDADHLRDGRSHLYDDDVGMTTKNCADLLDLQRASSNDITKGLEARWLKSHFFDLLPPGQVSPGSECSGRRKKASGSHIPCENIDLQRSQYGDLIVKAGTDAERSGDELSGIKDVLSIVHFNDVYEISERAGEPVGGAARFTSLVKSKLTEAQCGQSRERPLLVFSGDCLNPSTLSCATQGCHMIEVLNHLEVDVAVFGNHEFDFGVDHATRCTKEMTASWLLGNVVDRLTEKSLAGGLPTWTVERRSGLKVGFVGLVEEEWLDTLATLDKDDVDYQDFVRRGRMLAQQLREGGVDFVIALTHMRWPNDIRLAREVPEIDLVLGGHDHEYGVKQVEERLIVKSGSDFRTFSNIDIFIRSNGCLDVSLERHDVTSEVTPDWRMAAIVDRYMATLKRSLDKRIGTIGVDLNGEFTAIRRQETTLGNLVADVMATATKADLVLINSGTFRSDATHPRGDFRLHDLMSILPINDAVVTIMVTGRQLLEALENGVSGYPKLEGRFPQVSGISFGFDPCASPGRRVVLESITIRGRPLDLNRKYKMATKAYVARGKDGYTCLRECTILTDPTSGPLLSTVVRNHVMNVKRLMEFERNTRCQVRISDNGRVISCGRPDVDISQAFKDCETESPVHIIQTSMKPIMNGRVTSCPAPAITEANDASPIHLPHFIAATGPLTGESPIPEHLATQRAAARNADRGNGDLLIERARSPGDLRWQITPLLEGRIFECKRANTDD